MFMGRRCNEPTNMTGDRSKTVPKKTTARSLEIVEALMALDGGTLSEVAAELNLAKSTAYSHLETLHEFGYVTKEGSRYHIGLQFLHVGGYAMNRRREHRMVKAKVRMVAKDTRERAQFIVEEGGRGIYTYMDAEAPPAVQTDVWEGKWAHLHSTAAGKAILASLPLDRVQEVIDRHGLPECTDSTITEEDELFEALERICERGYAYNRGERLEKQRAVGVPIVGETGEVLGGMSVSGPEHRMTGERFEEDLPNMLLGVADELELNLAHP